MKKTKKKSQSDVIIEMLLNDQLVTPSSVFKETKKQTGVGCMKLSTRIGEIKKLGYKIKGEMTYTKTSRFMSYELQRKVINNRKK